MDFVKFCGQVFQCFRFCRLYRASYGLCFNVSVSKFSGCTGFVLAFRRDSLCTRSAQDENADICHLLSFKYFLTVLGLIISVFQISVFDIYPPVLRLFWH